MRLMVGVVVGVPAIEQLDAPIVARGPPHTHERLVRVRVRVRLP